MEDRKRLVQMASRIKDALACLKRYRFSQFLERLTKTTGNLHQLDVQTRRMSLALQHHWLAAADSCSVRAYNLLNEVSYAISRVQQLNQAPQKQPATLALIIDELRQLEDEFGDIDFENAENTLSVTTEPITLEGVALGPFKIQLELDALDRLYYSSPYRVIALDPHPAGSDNAVTHPHVNGEKLCEGDGCAAIRAAIEEGRIGDFFILVRSILNTYSADSPYVPLDEWEGACCYDCGCTVTSEDIYCCERCENDYCPDCSTYCRQCSDTICLGCAGQCSHCEEFICRKCAGKCRECGKLFCPSCLEENVCPNCQEDKENEDELQEEETNERETTSETQPPATEVQLAIREGQCHPEIQPDGVGEAAVLQGQIG